MCCIVRTYFRGNWQSQGGVRSTTKNAPCAKLGAFIVLQQPLLFSEGTHPLREGACRKKHIFSEQTGVCAAFCERKIGLPQIFNLWEEEGWRRVLIAERFLSRKLILTTRWAREHCERGRCPRRYNQRERSCVWAIKRAPAKLVTLWEEEQTRSSSICSANSYDKRIATSERSYEGIGVRGL